MTYLKLILLFLFLPASVHSDPKTNPVTSEQRKTAKIALHELQQEIAIAKLLEHLRKTAPTVPLVIHNVRVLDVALRSIVPHQSVVTSEGRIIWVGDVAAEPKLPKKQVIDGKDQYLASGLNDMHVHGSSAGGWLLDLANGVTGVRDMAGFPWMLKARSSINAGKMLAPSLAVAGPLINGYPLEGYAVVPADALDAMRIVREEAACGYNFVKVHNIVPLPIFDAVAKQAAIEGMDLIGHVPHDITVRHAAAAGMRTMEHLKGFINDATLKPGEQDYAAVVDGYEVWNTPTLYSMRAYARGPEAETYLASPEMRFVPRRRGERWSNHLQMPEEAGEKLVLLTSNPLDDASAYRRNIGVMAHGVWLDRSALDSALDHLASIYAEDDAATVFSKAAAQGALSEARLLRDQGFVFDSGYFSNLADSLREAGAPNLAAQADRLADIPTMGPCSEQRP